MSLHWLTALLAPTQFFLAETWGDLGRPTRHTMTVAHMSFGIPLTAVIAPPVVGRLISRRQMPPAASGVVVALAAKTARHLPYVMLTTGHAATALYHHFIVRDRVPPRMLPLARDRR